MRLGNEKINAYISKMYNTCVRRGSGGQITHSKLENCVGPSAPHNFPTLIAQFVPPDPPSGHNFGTISISCIFPILWERLATTFEAADGGTIEAEMKATEARSAASRGSEVRSLARPRAANAPAHF